MAKVKVCGDAIVIESALKLEEIANVQKFRPEALVLKGGEDGKTPVFALSVTKGAAGIGPLGAQFKDAARETGKATMTIVKHIEGDVKAYIADNFGGTLAKLNALEATLPGVLSEIQADRETIMASVEEI